ncbi:4-hydroxyphenylacetate 3-monooxygenase [Salmonella enterica subsp. arizonae]|uniref:4-hydroxyphenylacetate 3-monooxygenase n=1 Tax=Salmonella enterica subsp. arizonae TaxID=59203 RepID=A0A379TDZ1_SALER|nr:4-hydroxyphenylacetate 3-monooxygenase [Salmonella enterica subsp. arizonae]
MIGFGSAQVMGENPDFALMFVAPMDAEGVKLISRASYEMVAGATGSPFDYPLSSRFDENDAILVMDKVLIPWENVLIYRDFDRCRRWTMEGGFARMYPLQACVRLAVKLDFNYRSAEKITRMYGHRGVPGRAGRSRRSSGLAQYVLGIERFHVF